MTPRFLTLSVLLTEIVNTEEYVHLSGAKGHSG